MTKYLLFILPLWLIGCKPKPEFYINSEPYYTQHRCIESHDEEKFDYHWGYSILEHKYCQHVGRHTDLVCDKEIIDTIKIK